MRTLLAALALGVGALLAAGTISGCKNDAGPVTTVEPEKIYNQMCARCHGLDGNGVPEVAATIPVRDLTSPELQARPTEDLERVIMGGQNQMPAFGEVLSPRKIQALVGYIKGLGKP